MEIILDNKAIIIIILDSKATIIIILHHLGQITVILDIIKTVLEEIMDINSNFVKIKVIVLEFKCIVMGKILIGCIRIAKEHVDFAMEDSNNNSRLWLIVNGQNGNMVFVLENVEVVKDRFFEQRE